MCAVRERTSDLRCIHANSDAIGMGVFRAYRWRTETARPGRKWPWWECVAKSACGAGATWRVTLSSRAGLYHDSTGVPGKFLVHTPALAERPHHCAVSSIAT